MSCSHCNNNPCRCSKCTKCSCNPCKCGCNPTAYYNTADVCEEDNCQKIYVPQFYFAVCPELSWNVPQCGFSAILTVPGLQGASVGGYIWNINYGYFEIISVDANKGQIGITNNCTPGNAAPGTQIPGCTCFVVTDPPPDSLDPSTGKACLEIDFTAPDVGNCIDIIVSQTTGLVVASKVQIGTGFYLLTDIKPDNVITICNEGEGILPGTPVIAKDINGNFLYCLQSISLNPCDRPLTSGKIVICDADSGSNSLSGGCAGFVPTETDALGTVEFRPITSQTCLRLTSTLSILNGTANYTLNVTDAFYFAVGDIVTVAGRGERFEVTGVIGSTQLTVTATPTPGSNQDILCNSLVCLITCCESACFPQASICPLPDSSPVTGTLYAQAVTLTPGGSDSFEITLDANLGTFTAPAADPTDCDNALIYYLQARINLAALLDYDLSEMDSVPVISGELRIWWQNNPGVAGRFNWTDTMPDGVDIAAAYPATGAGTTGAIWGFLQILNNNYPITFHGGEVIAETILFAGQSTSLVLDCKLIQGDNNYPLAVRTLAAYAIGELTVMRVNECSLT